MKTIQVRNVSDDVHQVLRTRAAASGLSLSDYVLHELERLASRPTVGEVLRRAEARSGGVAIADVVDAVRDGRDRS